MANLIIKRSTKFSLIRNAIPIYKDHAPWIALQEGESKNIELEAGQYELMAQLPNRFREEYTLPYLLELQAGEKKQLELVMGRSYLINYILIMSFIALLSSIYVYLKWYAIDKSFDDFWLLWLFIIAPLLIIYLGGKRHEMFYFREIQ